MRLKATLLLKSSVRVNYLNLTSNMIYLQRMKAGRCPTDDLSLTNCAIVNKDDFGDDVKYVQ